MDSVKQQYHLQALSEQGMRLPSRYVDPTSIDNWRHTRMLDLTAPLWQTLPSSSWMTVGDGRYGSDASYLCSKNVDVIATSLTDERLRKASELGHIGRFQAENAESISLADASVDFVLCKEAYHHFPRPTIALYEMLRVARTAVVLIEPLDDAKLLDGLKRVAKRLIRGDREQQFEPSGNYLYRLSIREVEKTMTAMGGKVICYKKFNDFFHGKLSAARSDSQNMSLTLTKSGIAVQDALASIGLLGYGLVGMVIFKGDTASPQLLSALQGAGFTAIRLPQNPYV